MESLVYEDSPLADYLEGEGEHDQNWTRPQIDTQDEWGLPPNFAPRGISTFQSRIRQKLPAPYDIQSSRSARFFGRIRNASSVIVSSRIGQSDNERFLERFGYVIVASQLLNKCNAPSYTSATSRLSNAPVQEPEPLPATFGLREAIVTITASFTVAWLIHWSRSETGSYFNPPRAVALLILLPVVGIVFLAFAKRQRLKYVRHQAIEAASAFIANAQGFDSAASAALVFIQEVELVSRGYRISTPLPPITRLEEGAQVRRCMRLRQTTSECLFSLLERYVQAEHSLQLLADIVNLAKYHDIYDISSEDLHEAISALTERGSEDEYSLRSLRTLFSRLYTMRKSILCSLLALSADGGGSDIVMWGSAVEEMRDLAAITGKNIARITSILNEDDCDVIPPPPLTPMPSSKGSLRAQVRRLNSLSQAIRALHAKMHVICEEADAGIDYLNSEQDPRVSLMTQYESIGADIRGLLQEWEAGKSSLMTNLEKPGVPDCLSRSSSGTRSPLSSTFSLEGATVVDGSPTAALRALNGESQPPYNPDNDMDDEEVFEAVVLRSRKRTSLTREERIARAKEDRARQATARERAEANTSMLRELETVIKFRPQGKKGQRITTI